VTMRIQFLLAWRYLWGRKQRMVLTTLAVVFGVTLLFGLNSMIPAMMGAFRHNMVTSAGKVDISISGESNNPFDQSVLNDLNGIEGISQFTGILSKNVVLPESMGGSVNKLTGASAVMVTGVDVNTAQTVRNYSLSEGRFLEVGDTYSTVIPQLLADKMELQTGDIFPIPSSEGVAELKVVGILSLCAAAGLDEILVPLPVAQSILNLPEKINTIDILIKPGVNRDTVVSSTLAKLGSNYKSGAIQTGEELASALIMGESMMWLFGIMALAMAGFIIFNTFRTVVAERCRDLGMLRAIGASKHTVMGLIMVESLIQGVIGTGLGLVFGYLFCLSLLSGVGNTFSSLLRVTMGAPVITTGNLVGSILLGVGFTIGSGYFPARSAMKITPMEAMRPTLATVEYHQNNRRAIWGLILLALSVIGLMLGDVKIAGLSGVVFLVGIILIAPVMVKPVADIFGRLISSIYPREGRLAQGNLSRQPSRAAITASSMMIGLAICIAMMAMITSIEHGFITYLDKSLGTDYLLLPPSLVLGGGNLGANQGLMDRIKSIEGVEDATSLRLATSQVDDATLQIIGVDPLIYSKIAGLEFSEGDSDEAFKAMANGSAIIVNGVFAITNDVKSGDVLTLKTPQGRRDYTVVGIGFDYLNAKIATGYISQADLAQDFHSESDLLLLVNRKPGATAEEVTTALKTVIKDYPTFSLIDSYKFKTEQMEMFKMAMSVFYLMVIMLAVPGLIAMANTMSINVIERTREIGMLRAVGATQTQVKRMVFAESVLLSALGTTMGIMVGLFLSYLLVKAISVIGFKTVFYFPTMGIIASMVVGLVFGIIAAMVPARQAANTVIVEALHYE
ncbi:MAG: ABC transporter permease, partial [Ignavibacteria bacterium]|nr:ABC transporter permease [Ignavibacteria bacterium]